MLPALLLLGVPSIGSKHTTITPFSHSFLCGHDGDLVRQAKRQASPFDQDDVECVHHVTSVTSPSRWRRLQDVGKQPD